MLNTIENICREYYVKYNEDNILYNKKIGFNEVLILIITAIGIITICSKSSFLYPFNDWVDANCFFTVGKSMMNGLVVYKDLFEQKGLLLYFIHGLAWFISNDTFIGVYIFEVIACFIFLLYSYKIMRLYCDSRIILMIPIMAIFIYTSNAFCHGDSAEELCFPFLTYSLYISLKALVKNKFISNRELLIIGMTAGCVFWIKFTLVGFYIGWFITLAIIIIMDKNFKKLFYTLLYIILGIFIVTIPIIIYFVSNNAFIDLLKVYFYDNIFLYNSSSSNNIIISVFFNLLRGVKYFLKRNFLMSLFILVSFVWVFIIEKKEILFHIIGIVCSTFFFIFVGSVRFPYYSFLMYIFSVFGFIFIFQIIQKYNFVKHIKIQSLYIITFFCIIISSFLTPNRYLLGVDKEELPQYKFKDIISKEENPTLLNYGFLDGGFYTTCNIIPNCKAFCKIGAPIKEMLELQEYYVENGICDFVVTRDEKFDFEKYDCIYSTSFYFEEETRDYYLYKLK